MVEILIKHAYLTKIGALQLESGPRISFSIVIILSVGLVVGEKIDGVK